MSQDTTAALQDRIDQLEAEQQELREELARNQLEQWEGRVDDFELQLHLGGMELRDRIEPLLSACRERVAEARSQIESGASNASDAIAAVRDALQQAWGEVRSGLDKAKDSLTG